MHITGHKSGGKEVKMDFLGGRKKQEEDFYFSVVNIIEILHEQKKRLEATCNFPMEIIKLQEIISSLCEKINYE